VLLGGLTPGLALVVGYRPRLAAAEAAFMLLNFHFAMGLLFSLHSVGGALGSFAGGWVFDLFAQYDWMWLASFAMALLAAFLSILVHEPHRTGFIRVPAPA